MRRSRNRAVNDLNDGSALRDSQGEGQGPGVFYWIDAVCVRAWSRGGEIDHLGSTVGDSCIPPLVSHLRVQDSLARYVDSAVSTWTTKEQQVLRRGNACSGNCGGHGERDELAIVVGQREGEVAGHRANTLDTLVSSAKNISSLADGPAAPAILKVRVRVHAGSGALDLTDRTGALPTGGYGASGTRLDAHAAVADSLKIVQ